MSAREPPAKDPKYDQAFFLELAANGKDAWNTWRRDPANNDVPVTFAGIDFSEAPRDQIEFSGFEFGDRADFSGCKWRGVEQWIGLFVEFEPGRARFDRAVFGQSANFKGTSFGDMASFVAAGFGALATFDGATFGDDACFGSVSFSDLSRFKDVEFGHRANFNYATFGVGARFEGASFGYELSFRGAAFGPSAHFDDVHFKGCVKFTARSVIQRKQDSAAYAVKALKNEDENLPENSGTGPDRILAISFTRARFDGEADFSGRSFEETADFTEARFWYPPDFAGTAEASRIDFAGARICFVPQGELHWTTDSRVLVRLRAFRKVAEETKNHDLERDLYIEERKAERGVYLKQLWEELNKPEADEPLVVVKFIGHALWISVMFVYWALADYGRSFLRPTVWLISSVWLFHWGYALVLAPLAQQVGAEKAAQFDQATWMLARGNAVPFVGPLTIDVKIKDFLFCAGKVADKNDCVPIPPEGFQLLVIVQNVLSIALVFFIGLALRNYFKIK